MGRQHAQAEQVVTPPPAAPSKQSLFFSEMHRGPVISAPGLLARL